MTVTRQIIAQSDQTTVTISKLEFGNIYSRPLQAQSASSYYLFIYLSPYIITPRIYEIKEKVFGVLKKTTYFKSLTIIKRIIKRKDFRITYIYTHRLVRADDITTLITTGLRTYINIYNA